MGSLATRLCATGADKAWHLVYANHQHSPNNMKTRGFTLVELVMVMIVIGVLAVVALPRFFDRLAFDELGFFDQTKSMLRYAQKLAVAQNRNVFVRLNGSSVALCYDAGCAAHVVSPAGRSGGAAACNNDRTWFCEVPPSGISYSSANALFYFSAQGRPFNPGDTVLNSTFNTQLNISITGGGSTRVIFVEQETGHVHS